MRDNRNPTSVQAEPALSELECVPAANPDLQQATRLPLQQRPRAFTLAELLVSVSVLVLLVFFATQLLNTTATVATLAHKKMDLDSQSRQLLDRMAIDFAQMVKRSDIDYYVKSSSFATGSPSPPPTGCTATCVSAYSMGVRTLKQPGNDTIAFYSNVPGYYPSGSSSGSRSPASLVAYRVNAQNKLERMGKGLLWNAATPSPNPAPVVFMPIPIASPIPIAELPNPTPSPAAAPAWPEIACTGSPTPCPAWSDSEVIGPQVFRFEYYYLLKGQPAPLGAATPTPTPFSSVFSDTPWDTRICSCQDPTPTPTVTPTPGTPTPSPSPPVICCHTAPEGMQDVAAVVVVIAVIDPQSKALLSDAQIAQVSSKLIDWGDPSCGTNCTQAQWQTTPGLLRAQWQNTLNGITNLPRPAISGIRVYERYLYLSPPNLQTP